MKRQLTYRGIIKKGIVDNVLEYTKYYPLCVECSTTLPAHHTSITQGFKIDELWILDKTDGTGYFVLFRMMSYKNKFVELFSDHIVDHCPFIMTFSD